MQSVIHPFIFGFYSIFLFYILFLPTIIEIIVGRCTMRSWASWIIEKFHRKHGSVKLPEHFGSLRNSGYRNVDRDY
ncbi:MAG: hypothetical protein G01um101425_58 [Candidatus Peregrinibacteria bacterium Gr01-1014_25]|nr:MAG: hypothetical protein G01um101425_58 [Candidatus Peregrinibacteria bacterium Gr01-1014_25]